MLSLLLSIGYAGFLMCALLRKLVRALLRKLLKQPCCRGNDILDVAAWSLYVYYKDGDNDDGSSVLRSHPYVGLGVRFRVYVRARSHRR